MVCIAPSAMLLRASDPHCHPSPPWLAEMQAAQTQPLTGAIIASKQLLLVSILLTCKLYAKKTHAVLVDVHIDSGRYPADPASPQMGAGATAAASRLEVTMEDVTQVLSGESFIGIASFALTAARHGSDSSSISTHSSPLERYIHRWQPTDRGVVDGTWMSGRSCRTVPSLVTATTLSREIAW